MARILLAGRDWQARALLRAQLIEEGLDIEAHQTVESALESLRSRFRPAALFIADLSASDDWAADVRELAKWSSRVPIWVIATRSVIEPGSLEGQGFEAVYFRPIDVAALVSQIKQRLS